IDLYGWEFKLGWNPNLLDVVDVTEGPFLKQGGETFFTKKINDTEGYILVDCTLLGNVSGVSGDGTLAYVKFYAEIQGSCVLDLYDTELVSSVEQPIDHIAEDGSVTVSKSVGGVIIPVSKLELLAPWIGSASTITFALATIAVLVKRKKKGKRNTKRRMKKRGSRKTLVWGLLCFFLIILICYAIYSFSNSSNVNAPQASCLKVAIVDHLSLSQPNQTFIQTSTNILETAGFTVDYYKGEEVTVEFY
ncbi:MAG: hypothetical protein GWN31_07570, partial [Candidatus Thorarchaeota archaeon]|nr:hypothetical protein [Candidatus Thorarchaeota archaeon]